MSLKLLMKCESVYTVHFLKSNFIGKLSWLMFFEENNPL